MCVWKSYVFAHHLNVLCVVISITAASILQAPRNTVIFRTYLKTSAPACGHTVGVFSRNGPVRCKPTQIINNISFFLLRCVCGAHKQSHWGVLSCRGQYKQCFLTGGQDSVSPSTARKNALHVGTAESICIEKAAPVQKEMIKKNTFSKTWVVHCDQVTKSTLQIIDWQIKGGGGVVKSRSNLVLDNVCGNENFSWWRNFYHGTKIYHIQLMTWGSLTGFPCMTPEQQLVRESGWPWRRRLDVQSHNMGKRQALCSTAVRERSR